jgi:hypothetical protein
LGQNWRPLQNFGCRCLRGALVPKPYQGIIYLYTIFYIFIYLLSIYLLGGTMYVWVSTHVLSRDDFGKKFKYLFASVCPSKDGRDIRFINADTLQSDTFLANVESFRPDIFTKCEKKSIPNLKNAHKGL